MQSERVGSFFSFLDLGCDTFNVLVDHRDPPQPWTLFCMRQRNTKTPVITLSSQGTNSAVQATLVCSRKCQPPKIIWLLKTKGFDF